MEGYSRFHAVVARYSLVLVPFHSLVWSALIFIVQRGQEKQF